MLQIARGAHDQIAGNKTLPIGIENTRLLELFHRLLGPENRLAQGMVLPEVLGENLVHQIIGAVLIHLDFFEDHAPLAADVLHIEGGIQRQVAQNFHGDRQVLIEHLHVEADALLGGEGIHVAANRIDLAGNVLGGAVFGPFEDHVLDEMGDSIPLRVLVAGPGLDPYSDRDRANVLHLFGENGQPVRQNFPSDIVGVSNHKRFSRSGGAEPCPGPS